MPENASLERRKRIVAHGAKLITTDALKGYDEALREVHRLAERESERYFFADQYSNASNWQAHYHGTAVEILEQTGGNSPILSVGSAPEEPSRALASALKSTIPIFK